MVVIIVLIAMASMFGFFWKFIGQLIIVAIHVAKWTVVISLLTVLLNNQDFYEYFGFTPLSLVSNAAKDSYEQARLKYTTPGGKAPRATSKGKGIQK